eukprot:ctg_1139.g394
MEDTERPLVRRRQRPRAQEVEVRAPDRDGTAFRLLLPLAGGHWRLRHDPRGVGLPSAIGLFEAEPVSGSGLPPGYCRQYSVDGHVTREQRARAVETPVDPRLTAPKRDGSIAGGRTLRLLPPYVSDRYDADDERTVLVLGVNQHAHEAYLAEQFRRFGRVERVLIHRDEQRRHMGFVSVWFASRHAGLRAAAEMNGKTVMGAVLQVRPDPGAVAAEARRTALIQRRQAMERQRHAQEAEMRLANATAPHREQKMPAPPPIGRRTPSTAPAGRPSPATASSDHAVLPHSRCPTPPAPQANSTKPATERSMSASNAAPTHTDHPSPSGLRATRVRVAGVPAATPESILRAALTRFGRIAALHVVPTTSVDAADLKDVLVTYHHPGRAAEAAQRLDQHMLMGRRVHTSLLSEEEWPVVDEKSEALTNGQRPYTNGPASALPDALPGQPALRLTTLPFNVHRAELRELLNQFPGPTQLASRAPYWYVVFPDASTLAKFLRWMHRRANLLAGCSVTMDVCYVEIETATDTLHVTRDAQRPRRFATHRELLDAAGDVLEAQLHHAIVRDMQRELLDRVGMAVLERLEEVWRKEAVRGRLEAMPAGAEAAAEAEAAAAPNGGQRRWWEERTEMDEASLEASGADSTTEWMEDEEQSSAEETVAAVPKTTRRVRPTAVAALLDEREDQQYVEQVLAAAGWGDGAAAMATDKHLPLRLAEVSAAHRLWVDESLRAALDTYATTVAAVSTVSDALPENATGCARSEGYPAYARSRKRRRWMPPKQVERQFSDATTAASLRSNRMEHRQLLSALGDSEYPTLYLHARAKALRFQRSAIHGYGLWAMEDIPAGDFLIEYRGELIRPAVADLRERAYGLQGMGDSFLFRIDSDTVVDATHAGGMARFINHCCEPNATARIVHITGAPHILFYAKRFIECGEEITYDYHFEIEDAPELKIPCLCGAPGCRKYLN